MKKIYLALSASMLFVSALSAQDTPAHSETALHADAPKAVPESSVVYLRSMLQGDYLTGAGPRDLQAMLDATGFGFSLEAGSQTGNYRIRTHANGLCLGAGLTFESADAEWTIVSVNDAENIFAITTASGGSTMALTAVTNTSTSAYYNPAYTVALTPYRPGDHAQQWEIITFGDRTARAAAEGHKGRWIDMTYRIPAFSFPEGSTQLSGWQEIINTSWEITSYANYGIVSDDNGSMYRYYNEKFNSFFTRDSRFSLQTELTGLPDGRYRFACQVYNNNLNTNETNLRVWAGSVSIEPPAVSNDVHTPAMAGEAFMRGEGWIETDPVEVTDGKLLIKFDKKHTTSATAFCIDNLRLYYQPLQDNELAVTLDFPMFYNTLILPFSVSESEVNNLSNAGLHLFRAEGYEEKTQGEDIGNPVAYHLINLNSEPCHTIEANVPYVVVNTNVEELKGNPLQPRGNASDSARLLMATPRADGNVEYTFRGKPVNTNYYTDQTDRMHTLTGAFVATNIFPGHYNLAASQYLQGFMQNTSDAPRHIEPYRAYVNSISSSAARYPLFLFNDDFNILTGIEDVIGDADSAITDTTPVDVYSAGGVLLRRGVLKAEALNDLPRGIYILSNGPTTLKLAK